MPYSKRPDPRIMFKTVVTAGRHIRENFRNPGAIIELKPDGSPVTEVDLAVHKALLDYAGNIGIGYIGEEGNGSIEGDYILYVDPLDGTSSFRAGIPTVTVTAALMERVKGLMYLPIASIIHEPLTGWSWFTEVSEFSSRPFTWQTTDQELRNCVQAKTARPAQALITTIFPPGPYQALAKMRSEINIRQPEFKHQSCGSLGLCGGLIASGMLHGLVFGGGSAAEACAMLPIVRGADGHATDLSGKEFDAFELSEYKGKVDFVLQNGAIFGCNRDMTTYLTSLVNGLKCELESGFVKTS